MHVKLVSYTQAIPELQAKGINNPEELIIYCARVSNPINQFNTLTSPKLLQSLIKWKHWSPFEQADVCFEIQTSRAISQQILRHFSLNFQEWSQRYSEVQGVEPIELRLQGEKNRQVGEGLFEGEIKFADTDWGIDGDAYVQSAIDAAMESYKTLLANGVAREVARMVLPLATQTTLYAKGTVRDWLAFLNVRLEKNAQKEVRQIALEIANHLKELFPNVAIATNNFGEMKGGFM